MAAGTKLAPGESSCTNSEVASVPRVQLGCDQFHCQEAGGTAPSLIAFYFVTLCVLFTASLVGYVVASVVASVRFIWLLINMTFQLRGKTIS
uniref:Uncharacterized protein n=1 Tax=Arundo donax TaxID=35708 RepID=A0A0A9EBD8_ARUDO